VDIFQGQIKNRIECFNCNYTRHIFEPIMYLTLPIPLNKAKVNLYDCIRLFIEQEHDPEQTLTCEKCKKKCSFKKKIDLWKTPDILIIQLKRFDYDEELGFVKIMKHVSFPIKKLDLSEYCTSFQATKPSYYLFAICNHLGTAKNGGHYTTYSWNRKNDQWYFYDDDFHGEFEDLSKLVSRNAYL
jgi:ubiquitin C-terminal hydrolase